MSVPHTYDDVVTWFVTPRRGKTAPGHGEGLLRKLLAGMVARPGVSQPMTPEKAWNIILDFNMLECSANTGWIMRDGTVLGCNWAAHERLLTYYGIETAEAERHGWVRFNWRGYQCLYQLSAMQRRRLLTTSVLINKQAERDKPKCILVDDLLGPVMINRSQWTTTYADFVDHEMVHYLRLTPKHIDLGAAGFPHGISITGQTFASPEAANQMAARVDQFMDTLCAAITAEALANLAETTNTANEPRGCKS